MKVALPVAVALTVAAMLTPAAVRANVGETPAEFRKDCETTGGTYSRGKAPGGSLKRSYICKHGPLVFKAWGDDIIVTVVGKRLNAGESLVVMFRDRDIKDHGEPKKTQTCEAKQGFRCLEHYWIEHLADDMFIEYTSQYLWKPGKESGGLYLRKVNLKRRAAPGGGSGP
jgi:hypothetical protein